MADLNALEPGKVQMFASNVAHVGQQKKSRLVNKVMSSLNYGEKGDRITDERIGKSDPMPLPSEFAPTPEKRIPQYRRVAFPSTFVDVANIGNREKAEKLVDPTNPVVQALGMGLERHRDKSIISKAIFAPSMNAIDQDGSPIVEAFPASNILGVSEATYYKGRADNATAPVDSGSAGLRVLTPAKIRAAKVKLAAGELEPMSMPVVLYEETDLQNMLTSDELTSADYASIRRLEDGEINTWLGCEWVKVDPGRLPNVPGQSEQFYSGMYLREYVNYWDRPLVSARVNERPDRNYIWQAYYSRQDFALRSDDAAVVWITIQR